MWIKSKPEDSSVEVAAKAIADECRRFRSLHKSSKLKDLAEADDWDDHLEGVASLHGKPDFSEVSAAHRIKCYLQLLVAAVNENTDESDVASLKAVLSKFENKFYVQAPQVLYI
jgi:hypothetical protein